MKVVDFMRLLPLLPLRASSALSAKELTQRFYGLSSDDTPDGNQLRKIQNDLKELSDPDTHNRPPVLKVDGVYPPIYYLHDMSLVEWFMTEQVALNLLLARQTLKTAVGDEVLAAGALEQAASQLVNESHETRRLWSKVRIARSGIGRQAPKIEPQVTKVLLQAVMQERQVRCEYVSAKGHRSVKDITIHGLVLKDDSVYVLAGDGLSDPFQHLPAHRIKAAEVLHKPAQQRAGFDLEKYIEDDFQLSHVMNRDQGVNLIELQLRIRPDYEYHFRERPLCPGAEPVKGPDPKTDNWLRVTVSLPLTHMLKAFLQSMGPGVEVLSPPDLRAEMAKEARETAALYAAVSRGN